MRTNNWQRCNNNDAQQLRQFRRHAGEQAGLIYAKDLHMHAEAAATPMLDLCCFTVSFLCVGHVLKLETLVNVVFGKLTFFLSANTWPLAFARR